jgi:hypothetical protein
MKAIRVLISKQDGTNAQYTITSQLKVSAAEDEATSIRVLFNFSSHALN